MSNFTKLPKITWGTSFTNTLDMKYPLDDWRAYSEARQGSEFIQTESGIEDAWIIGEDFVLEGSIRWIPTTGSVSQSGWDGATGWRAFLSWARAKNEFRFYPDKDSGTYYTSYLVEPVNGSHELEMDGTRTVHIKIRNASGSYDGY